jgi:hypothetical protein
MVGPFFFAIALSAYFDQEFTGTVNAFSTGHFIFTILL